mmetsp:Transcript_15481/g.39470  ORF Transcript_15481/g.39470 Transcript_15481/m.39470 type:complete len:109 (-) Transcript_15481:25-351(-)
MKGGSCKDVFVAWEKCVDASRGDSDNFVENCLEQTRLLKDCMEENPDYYGIMLQAEQESLAEEEQNREANANANPNANAKPNANANAGDVADGDGVSAAGSGSGVEQQ